MNYKILYSKQAQKELSKLDNCTRTLIIKWIGKNLDGCTNPRQHGKALVANKAGQWRYRIGDYRIIAEIDDNNITILILNLGHRRDIYFQ